MTKKLSREYHAGRMKWRKGRKWTKLKDRNYTQISGKKHI